MKHIEQLLYFLGAFIVYLLLSPVLAWKASVGMMKDEKEFNEKFGAPADTPIFQNHDSN